MFSFLLLYAGLGFTRQLTRVTFEGPSIVHFDIDSPLGHMHLIKTLLPVEPFRQYTEGTLTITTHMDTDTHAHAGARAHNNN